VLRRIASVNLAILLEPVSRLHPSHVNLHNRAVIDDWLWVVFADLTAGCTLHRCVHARCESGATVRWVIKAEIEITHQWARSTVHRCTYGWFIESECINDGMFAAG
jgi:bacteriorhodopsin